MRAIEERLKGSGIKWTILRPGLFMQNLVGQAASIKDAGKIVGAAAKDLKIAFIDVRDTGAVGARILIDPAPHAGKTYEFTGKLISFGEIADTFSSVLGKPVSYVPVTLEQTEQALKARNLPDWLFAHMLLIAKLTADGGFSTENTKPIEDIVKRPPITIKKFVEDFKGDVCVRLHGRTICEGGCAVRGGALSARRRAPMFVHCCHCRDCQRQTGSAFVLNALIEADRVELLSGNVEGAAVPTDSGRPHVIHRCPSCKIAVWSVYGGVDKLRFVRIGTLDDPAALTPDVHIYTRSKLPWIALPDGVPAFEAYYDSKKLWPAASLERRRAIFG